MAASKQRTTWSKIQRESAKREKREDKAARKVARRLALDEPGPAAEFSIGSPAADGADDAGRDDRDQAEQTL